VRLAGLNAAPWVYLKNWSHFACQAPVTNIGAGFGLACGKAGVEMVALSAGSYPSEPL